MEGLRSGRIKEGGWITPDDLFEYLAAHRVIKGVREEQRPTKSTVRATRSLPFARSVRLPDAPRDTARADVSSLHTGVVTELLSDDAAGLLACRQPSWQEGNGIQMLKAVRVLLSELGVPELEPLDLSSLSERSVMDSLRPGAHNAAVLLAPSGLGQVATEGLVDNLLQMSTRAGQIAGTALGALLIGAGEGDGPDRDTAVVTVVSPGPGNESQVQVISSAMTRRLTIATGPPGTGKSEVVTAVVATAVAAGQTVLVASTNNEAVDVVAERCDEISPGLLMRTGNVEAREREAAKPAALPAEPIAAPARGAATVAGELRNRHARTAALRMEAAGRIGEEARLLELVRERARRADGLALPVRGLQGAWAAEGPAALARWEVRARRAVRAGWPAFGKWRRGRALAALADSSGGAFESSWPAWASERPAPPELLLDLAETVAVERARGGELVPVHPAWDEDALKQARLESAAASSVASRELAFRGRRGHGAGRVADAPAAPGAAPALGFPKSQRNLMAHLKAWAISTHSVRQPNSPRSSSTSW
ncbi:AAA domain-containing protein [Streptomyces sp. LN699]|uniref:AAA domain-containing protein n=1 Tax=Streptomyces sp. LN699 TaxID=3112981 RepID=UPI003720595D